MGQGPALLSMEANDRFGSNLPFESGAGKLRDRLYSGFCRSIKQASP